MFEVRLVSCQLTSVAKAFSQIDTELTEVSGI